MLPPVKPMLAKAVDRFPEGDLAYEPKWDGFRCIVFRDGDEIVLGSRNTKPLDRYFPELLDDLRRQLPERCVIDGEIIVVNGDRLDFDALGQRIHPAESRVRMLAERTPASFVGFDLLATGQADLRGEPFAHRREALADALGGTRGRVHLCPSTLDAGIARQWFDRFEGAGLDGLIAKVRTDRYVEDKRVQFKVKHQRTADCVVAGFRPHKDGAGVGSLLLGLYDDDGRLQHLGVAAGLSARRREEFLHLLGPLTEGALDGHPWAEWSDPAQHEDGRMPGAPSRWSNGKDHSWLPVRLERAAEVGYVTVTNGRFRGVASFVRWRDDRDPASCRFDQLVEADPLGVSEVLAAR